MITYETTSNSSSGAMLLPSSAPQQCFVGESVSVSSGSCGGGSGSSSSGNVGGGVGGGSSGGCTDLAVSNAPSTHCVQEQGDPRSSSSGFVVHHPLPSSDTHIINFPQAYIPDNSDPLSFFLASGRSDRDPFGFGVGSVADGTFGGRKPTGEELLLFRSHRLLQAEAVSVAIGPSHSSSASTRQRFALISTALARQVRVKVLEQTDAAVECVRALGGSASASQQQDIINVERRTCHRLLAGILDSATSSLRELSVSGGGGGSSTGEPGVDLGANVGIGRQQVFSSSLLGSPPPTTTTTTTESQQLAASTWESGTTSSQSTSNIGSSMNSIQQLPSSQQQQQQQQSIVHMPPGMGRSSIFALTQMRDRSQHHTALGASGGERQATGGSSGLGLFPSSQSGRMQDGGGGFDSGGSAVPVPSMSPNHGGLSAPTPFGTWNVTGGDVGRGGGGGGKQAMSSMVKANIKSGLLTKMGSRLSDIRRPVYNNRKGSRHRLTPQAKEILEGWLAKHWLNPYPTEDEKVYLAQACLITVTQVNNWMMNVRVRRCRTKKIGVATGPEQITYPATVPKAIAANKAGASLPAQARFDAATSSSCFDGAMVPRRKVETGGARSVARGLGTRPGVGDRVSSAVTSVHRGTSVPRVDQSRQSRNILSGQPRIDQSNAESGTFSPTGTGSLSPRSTVSGVLASPWHPQQQQQQEPSHGGQMTPAGLMPV